MSNRGAGTILFGGSGFLGPAILRRYPEMVSVGRTAPDLANRHIHIDSLADLGPLRDVEFDKVIFIIGNTDHKKLERETIPVGEPTAFDYHVTPLVQTLEQLKGRKLRKFVHFSTILMYDEKRLTLPVNEDAPIDPYKTRYVTSKYLAEEVSKYYARWVPMVTVRLSNIYGPTRLRRVDLVHLLCRKLIEEGRSQMWSTRPERDFIHIEDAGDAVVQLLDSEFTGTVNLGSGTLTSAGRIKEILEAESGGSLEVLDVPVQGPMQFQCDITRLRRAIDWAPRYTIEEGLRQTYREMKRYLSSQE